jgi:hypothetical protein
VPEIALIVRQRPRQWQLQVLRGHLDQARWAHGRRIVAHADPDGRLAVYLYQTGSDNEPADVTLRQAGGTVTLPGETQIESTGCTGVAVWVRRNGICELVYCQDELTRYRVTRDGGRTWGEVTDVGLADGYIYPAQAQDGQGRSVVCLYSETNARWEVQVGTQDAAGVVSYHEPPAVVVAAEAHAGRLIRRDDGVLELTYVPLGATAPAVVRCRRLESDNTGVWT